MVRRIAVIAVTAACCLAISAAPAYASCIYDGRSLDRKISEAPIVFVGRVQSVSFGGRRAVVEVQERWKGPRVASLVTVEGSPFDLHPNAFSSVDRNFAVDTTYLFFPTVKGGGFRDNGCSPTTEFTKSVGAHRPPGVAPVASPVADLDSVPPEEEHLPIASVVAASLGVAFVGSLVVLSWIRRRSRQTSPATP